MQIIISASGLGANLYEFWVQNSNQEDNLTAQEYKVVIVINIDLAPSLEFYSSLIHKLSETRSFILVKSMAFTI